MVAFICTLLVGFAGVVAVIVYGRRRPIGAPLSWGQAMAAAMFAMFMFLWWYAIIPHQWLTWSSNELGWTPAKPLLEPTGNQPLTVHFQTVRDIVTVVIYGVGIAIHVGLWAWWNDRAKQKPVAIPASRYGRPLVRKG
ncbi:MAG: hypothetical protein ACRDZN_17240 [Acidimicrobiales bacterium]